MSLDMMDCIDRCMAVLGPDRFRAPFRFPDFHCVLDGEAVSLQQALAAAGLDENGGPAREMPKDMRESAMLALDVLLHIERITRDAEASTTLKQSAEALEEDIFRLAGERFDIGDPQQLGDILFGKLGYYPAAKRTALGAWAVSNGFLEKLAERGSELPQRILTWRKLADLEEALTENLPAYVDEIRRLLQRSFLPRTLAS